MKIECQFMEVGKPLFLMGTNFGEKLKPGMKGLKSITWDTEEKRAEVVSDKGTCFITESWVFSFEPIQNNQKQPIQVSHPMNSVAIKSAQVSTPHDVIQGGTKVKRAKYQGEETQGE